MKTIKNDNCRHYCNYIIFLCPLLFGPIDVGRRRHSTTMPTHRLPLCQANHCKSLRASGLMASSSFQFGCASWWFWVWWWLVPCFCFSWLCGIRFCCSRFGGLRFDSCQVLATSGTSYRCCWNHQCHQDCRMQHFQTRYMGKATGSSMSFPADMTINQA